MIQQFKMSLHALPCMKYNFFCFKTGVKHLIYFKISVMSDSESESEYKTLSSVEDLNKWSVKQLKCWLEKNNLKRSGNKAILVKRVYRSLRNKEDSESDLSDIEENEPNDFDINKLSNDWSSVSSDSLPDINNGDIENYYLMKKKPLSGKTTKFSRQLKKARKFSAENFLCNIQQHNVDNDAQICVIRANCKPSMRSVVKVGTKGQIADTYSLNVCLAKSTGHVVSAYCNCKAGEAGLCAHVGGLLFSLVNVKNVCTSQICRWNEPQPMLKKPAPRRVHEVKFSQDDGKLRPYPDAMQFSACKDPDQFLIDLLDGMDIINPGCVLYKTLKSCPADISSFLKNFQPEFQF